MTLTSRIFRCARSVSVAMCAGLILAGCQNMPLLQSSAADARALVSDLPPPAQRAWPATSHDVTDMRAQGMGLVHMPAMQRYLNGLLKRIKQEAGVPDWPGEVHILASSNLEALATGAGNIYISQAWLASMESEDEVVALLGHEFAHIYLHYSQVAETVPQFNTVAALVASGATLAMGKEATAGWSRIDTGLAAYAASREILTTSWARTQESDADIFAANISMKLGYSPDPGIKTLLERLATWEENDASERQAARHALTELMRKKAEEIGPAKQPGTNDGTTVPDPFALLAAHFAAGVDAGLGNLEDFWGNMTSTHPEVLSRLDRISAALAKLPPQSLKYDATTAPWEQALRHRETVAILKNYAMATQALANVDARDAAARARQSIKGATARHALPLYAVYLTRMARSDNSAAIRVRASSILMQNIRSSQHYAWISFITRSEALMASGQQRAAQALMSHGFQEFKEAQHAWPYTIEFTGRTVGWKAAKQMAEECKQRFPLVAEQCRRAALSPAERQKQQKESEAKAGQLLQKILKW